MLDNIINNLKTQLTGELQNKYNLDSGQANRAVDLAKDNLKNEMTNRASNGDFGGIMDVLKGHKGPTESPAVGGAINKYIGDLTTKLGIPETMAKQIAPFVITFIMNKFSSKVTGEGMGQTEILGSLLGGGGVKDAISKGIGNKLGGLFK
ncbi:hypothetical protein CLV24_114116 [Pontibacter ummariensis]|uniref:DUF937 domain-containing protein n=1 Tax=Pontibacter ummariensis TaxID=1610492 RepID=A0A239HQT2_9BACT|nr:hypothetical protein [Pontibacter ummariensis]PRY10387.1 hypothetical protein CLV24_114116 [Pontibacter ummariensis]SNS83646.1 hypothetical protein SAMN06296052_114116 [Pontibacter ummariensis]